MAIYSTTFEEYTNASLLGQGWSAVWNNTNATWNVVNSISGLGGKHVNQDQTVNDDRGVRLTAVPTFTNGEILAKFMFTQKTMYQNHLHLRLSGSSGSKNSYYVAVSRDGGEDRIYLEQWYNNTYYYITHAVTSYNINQWYWIRFRADGRRFRVKFWPNGAPETAGWLIDYTDNTGTYNPNAGYPVIGAYQQDGTRRWDYVAFTTNGETAPFPATNSERGGILTGYTSVWTARDAVLTGRLDSDSERSGVLTGYNDLDTERGSVLTGYNSTTSERGATLEGYTPFPTNDTERGAALTGYDNQDTERSATVTGRLDASSERGATLIGQAIQATERSATLTGWNDTSSDRGAVLTGWDSTSSQRGATLEGYKIFRPELSERGAWIAGTAGDDIGNPVNQRMSVIHIDAHILAEHPELSSIAPPKANTVTVQPKPSVTIKNDKPIAR